MTYPAPTPEQLEFFRQHGWLVVDNAIPHGDLEELEKRCERIIDEKETLANDWAWDAKESKEQRSFRIIQGSPTKMWPEIADQAYRKWLTGFASALMNLKLEFWYDQFLAKPPSKSAPTNWHQDEGYWGRRLLGHHLLDPAARRRCAQRLHAFHRRRPSRRRAHPPLGRGHGERPHHLRSRRIAGGRVPDPARQRDLPPPKTPHMTPANMSQSWRKAISNHLQEIGTGGQGEHYPWRVLVNQRAGTCTPAVSK